MNLRELISSTPYTTVHAPHRGHVAYSTRRRAGATVERTARLDLCAHPSSARLHTLARLATSPRSSNGTRAAEATRGLAYDALILDVTAQELQQKTNGSYTWANMPPTARLHYKDLSPHAAVTSYLESLNAARIPAALHHPTDGWSTNRSWMCSLYPHVLDELVHATAQRRTALTTTTKGTDQ